MITKLNNPHKFMLIVSDNEANFISTIHWLGERNVTVIMKKLKRMITKTKTSQNMISVIKRMRGSKKILK